MNLLLIGGAGFIGSSLVKRFVDDGTHKVVVMEPERANLSRLDDFKDAIEIVNVSITNLPTVEMCLEKYSIDVIIHLASSLIPSSTLEDYTSYITNIMMPTQAMMGMAVRKGIKFVYFSSGGTVYGNKESGILEEEDAKNPISYYGLSKLILEESIKFEQRSHGLRYLILRPSNPYGPGQNLYGKQGLIAVSIGNILQGKPVEIFGNGSVIRDFIYIDDLAEIVYRLIIKGVENQVLNIGSGIGYSVKEVVECIGRHVNKKFQIVYKEGRAVDVSAMILNMHKISMFLPFSPMPLDNGISRYLTYLRNKGFDI